MPCFNRTFFYICSHSPFRQHKTKDKHEIDRMTLTVVRGLRMGPVAQMYPCPFEQPCILDL